MDLIIEWNSATFTALQQRNLCLYPDESGGRSAQQQTSPVPEPEPNAANRIAGDVTAERREVG